MVTPSVGEVVLVPFPFSDLTQSKVRPAICLANAGRGDWILRQITSVSYGDPRSEPLTDADFETGGLQVPSVARPGKLFTAHSGLLIRAVGELKAPALARILAAVVRILQPSST